MPRRRSLSYESERAARRRKRKSSPPVEFTAETPSLCTGYNVDDDRSKSNDVELSLQCLNQDSDYESLSERLIPTATVKAEPWDVLDPLQNQTQFSATSAYFGDGFGVLAEAVDIKPTDIELKIEPADPADSNTTGNNSHPVAKPRKSAKVRKNSNKMGIGKNLQCLRCEFKTDKASAFKKHLRTHIDKPHICELCPYVSMTKKDIEEHTLAVRRRKTPIPCNNCDYVSTDSDDHGRHVATCIGDKTYECGICGFFASGNDYLCSHILADHQHLQKFKCPHLHCKYEGDLLRKHVISHGAERAYKCGRCQYSSHRSDEVPRHIRKVHEKQKYLR